MKNLLVGYRTWNEQESRNKEKKRKRRTTANSKASISQTTRK